MDYLRYFDLFDEMDREEPPRKIKCFKNRFDPFTLQETDFKMKYRFSKRYVRKIVELVRSDIEVQTRGGGLAVELQVCTALRIWARQEVQDDAADIHGLSQQSVTNVCRKVALALANKASLFIRMPGSLEEREQVVSGFRNICGFRNVIGAIDCTHIKIKKVGGDSAQYYEVTWYSPTKWHDVGHLSVTVYGAKGLSAPGLSGKVNAYCVFELDNARVQTHTVKGTTEPSWNKSYNFTVNDITSTLDVTVYDESIINSSMNVVIGKLCIPLLRINNDERRWYALKDRTKKGSAKGNCPRILLQMSVDWNPVTASLRILSPKETKYIKKRQKFNIPIIYSNLKFIREIFNMIVVGNEHIKHSFEWDDRQMSTVALAVWLVFWYFVQPWMMPLLLLIPFLYKWPEYKSCNNTAIVPVYSLDDDTTEEDVDNKDLKTTIRSEVYRLPELTLTIKNAIDYIVSEVERLNNLISFTVPYLSYLSMAVLFVLSAVLYFISVRYLFMGLGIYKFARKLLNPDRIPNNDILDFLSRVPDNETLRQWLELKVPEPNQSLAGSIRRRTPARSNAGSV